MSAPHLAPVPRGTRADTTSQRNPAPWVLAIGVVLALAVMAGFVLMDYNMNQPGHRLIKIFAGVGLGALILTRPRIGLFVIPVVIPFLYWIPVPPIPGVNPLNLMLGGVFVPWAVTRVFRREDVFRRGELTGTLGVLIAVAALSIVRGAAIPTGYSYNAVDSAIELFRSAVTVVVYVLVLAMARGERDRRLIAWAIVIGMLAEALVTIELGRNGSGSRAVGSIGQANELGTFLALYAVMAAALLPATRSWLGRIVLLGSVLAGSFGVILSVSRGAVVALVLGVGYVSIRSSKVFTAVLAIVLLTCPLWAPDYLKERMVGTLQGDDSGADELELEGSAQLRIDTWKAIVAVVTSHPLDGVGFNGLSYVLPQTGAAMGMAVKDSSHNTFLRFLGEMGIGGLVLFCVILWRCWKLAQHGIAAARSAFDRQLGVGLAAATLGLAVSCAFGDRFYNIMITGSFWVACALVNDIVIERRHEPALAAIEPRGAR